MKTLEISEWRLADTEVDGTTDLPGDRYFMVRYPVPEMPGASHVHAIPMSGISYRMEVLGIPEPAEVMDFILQEANAEGYEKVKDVWPGITGSYFQSAGDYSYAAANEAMGSMNMPTALRRLMNDEIGPHEQILEDTRHFLKTGSDRRRYAMARPSFVDDLAGRMKSARDKSKVRLKDVNKGVTVKKNSGLDSLKQKVSDLRADIDSMADMHAHRAMRAAGSHYYAGLLHQEMKMRGML